MWHCNVKWFFKRAAPTSISQNQIKEQKEAEEQKLKAGKFRETITSVQN